MTINVLGGCLVIVSLLLLNLTACESNEPDAAGIETLAAAAVVRDLNPDQIAKGRVLYSQHCASCHGDHGQGAPNWRQRNQQGFYPAPPLNGSGHAWHHPTAMLQQVVMHGSPRDKEGRLLGQMPAWGDQLSAAQIDALVSWVQSLWPDHIYTAWRDRQQR